jgi:hypothetical protein
MKTRHLIPAVLILASACAAPARRSVTSIPPVVSSAPEPPPPPPPPKVENPNFELVVSEVVQNPSDDGVSYTKVFVDGAEAGKTGVGRKSQTRTLPLRLPAGNHPVRLEQWILPPVGEWTRLPDDQQPRVRFVRVVDGQIARVELRFADGESSYTLDVSHFAAPAPADGALPPPPPPAPSPAP